MIITIDGPAGTGKSSVSKKLAEVLGFHYFDTGALYRAFTWLVLKKKVSFLDIEEIKILLANFHFLAENKGGGDRFFVDNEDVTQLIRADSVTEVVSTLSALQIVREALIEVQIRFANQGNTILEGRDLGTVVFPRAEYKFFLTASKEVRAKRRLKENKKKFPDKADTLSLKKTLESIEKRDEFDSNREFAPLKKAEDAVLVDSSNLSIEQVVTLIRSHLKNL